MRPSKYNRLNIRRVKAKYSYSVSELAAVLKVHPGTIHRWADEEGLPLLDAAYPPMVYGADAIDFLCQRKVKGKIILQSNEFNCFKCHCARRAVDNTATLHLRTTKVGMLKAVCDTCGTRMNKNIGLGNMAEIEKTLKIIQPQESTLVGSEYYSVNSETKGGTNEASTKS